MHGLSSEHVAGGVHCEVRAGASDLGENLSPGHQLGALPETLFPN